MKAVYKHIENWGPTWLLVLAVSLLMLFRSTVMAAFPNSGGYSMERVYSAVFNWASIQSAFVFAIYGFIVTKTDGFIGKISTTHSFEALKGFTKRAYSVGIVLTIVTLPLMVVVPVVGDLNRVEYGLLALWFGIAVWTFAAFLRVAWMFGIVAGTKDRDKEIPG